jgi:hypothetical protein
MWSKVSVCKECSRRVLDEQLKLDLDKCVYCLIDHLKSKIDTLDKKCQDFEFAMELLDRSRTEILQLYEAAIRDNEAKTRELSALARDLKSYTDGVKVDPNDPQKLIR